MSDLEAMCHIDKGTYTDAPVLTADVRRLFDRISAMEAREERLMRLIKIAAEWMDDCKPLSPDLQKVWDDNRAALYES